MNDYNSFFHRLWYGYWRGLCQVIAITFFRIRCFERDHVPAHGGALLVCNHQSFLDPMAAALGISRPVNFMARDSLFRKSAFGWLISSVNAFPVKRGSADLGAIRESLRRLKAGKLLLLFGEGTRSRDGRIGVLQPGMAMIARRAKVPLIPVVIDGAFEAWPRDQKLFRCHDIRVIYGEPITAEQIKTLSDEKAVAIIYERQKQMQNLLRSRYGRSPYNYQTPEVCP